MHEEQFAVQTVDITLLLGTENFKTIVPGFWAESGKGIQEKINEPEQPGAFACLVVSVICDPFCAAENNPATRCLHPFSVITQVNKYQKDCFKLPLAHLGPLSEFSGKGGTHQRLHQNNV